MTYDQWKATEPDYGEEPSEQEKDERVYGPMCRNPSACKGKGYCPLDPNCGD